ncbi:uncharacterized protein [Bos indicus]|uniref:Uncharacterized protein isoform X2 n=1 Tax=Bos indicus TaxID=9915 RepID=A0ABM4SME4_BOSIN
MTEDKHTMGGFIPGFPKMPRFQAHHKHILGRALPKLKGHVPMSAGIYTSTWFMQCFINQSLPGPPPGPHDRPDSVTPLRPRQSAPPSLLKMAPLGPGHPSCPEAAAASIPPMSDQHRHGGARTAPQELRQGPTRPHDPLSSVSIGSLDVQGPPEDEVTVSTGTPRLPGTPRSPEASNMPCFFTLSSRRMDFTPTPI